MTFPRFGSCCSALALVAFAASAAAAQTTAPLFSITVQQGTTINSATDGSSIAFQADAIGRPTDATVNVLHLGVTPATPVNALPTGTATITSVVLTGSTDFSVTGAPDPSISFPPNQGFTLDIRYKPSTSVRVQGAVKITYAEQQPTVNSVTPKPTTGSFTLNLSGVAPEFTFAYQPPPGNNTTPYQANGTNQIPVTNVNDTPLATVLVSNIGSGPGVISAVAFSGSADFPPVNFPGPATSIDTMKTLSFGIRFSPLVVETVTGAVRLDFVDRSIVFNVSATSQGPLFAYDVVDASSVKAVLPGQTITLPDTSVTATTPGTVVVRVRNTGTADANIASIDVSGAGFSLTQVPFVPLTLKAGTNASVTINFTPTQPGPVSGGLRIGTDTFILTGTGLGQTLVYSFLAGGISTTVQNNGNVIFPPISVGQVSTLVFQISNNGTAPGSVNSISINAVQPAGTPAPPASTTPIFALSKAPSLPANIGAGETLSFTLTFLLRMPWVRRWARSGLTAWLFLSRLSPTTPGPMPPDYQFTGATEYPGTPCSRSEPASRLPRRIR